tara:strand:- start:288 stop:914 length:627 start_codon:yes stop_codon:yes gene_type:complete
MSLNEIKEAYKFSVEPSSEIIKLIKEICGKSNTKIKKLPLNDKCELLNMLNIISKSNKENILKKFELFTGKWNNEFQDVFFKVICSQHLYTDIYIDMFKCISQKYQTNLITRILELKDKDMLPLELKTAGAFLGKWLLFCNINVCEFFERKCINVQEKTSMVITTLITVCKVNKQLNYTNNNLYKTLKTLKLSTSSQLLLYDLEDLFE